MESKLKAILEELYTLDPSLRDREQELIPALKALLEAKPDSLLDANFAATLRQKLLTPSSQSRSSFMPTPAFNKFAFAGLGGLIALVVAVPITHELTSSGTSFEEFALSDVSSVPTINSVGADAFGMLNIATEAPLAANETRSTIPATTASGMGGGGMAEAADSKMAAPSSITIGEPYPGTYIEYTYKYTGEELDLSTVSDAVYRKNGGLDIGNMGNDLTRGKLGPINLSAFNGLEVQSFSVKQGSNSGYTIYVDPENGMISINGNQDIWGYSSGEYTPFREEQVMSDESLIEVSNEFLADYEIDTTGFGAPVVDDRGLIFARSQPADMRYIPEVMSVTYPLLLEGQAAYLSDASPYGLSVMVNMRNQKVVSVNLNVASEYDKSSYELERDTTKILSLAAQGGLYSYPYEGEKEVIEIELGTPAVILINHYSYSNDGGTGETLFIPALSFPITKNSETNPVYSNHIVIPLVKSVIEQSAQEPILYPATDTREAM